jgi:hypothetical protein
MVFMQIIPRLKERERKKEYPTIVVKNLQLRHRHRNMKGEDDMPSHIVIKTTMEGRSEATASKEKGISCDNSKG